MVVDITYSDLDFETPLKSKKKKITFSTISIDIVADIRLS